MQTQSYLINYSNQIWKLLLTSITDTRDCFSLKHFKKPLLIMKQPGDITNLVNSSNLPTFPAVRV